MGYIIPIGGGDISSSSTIIIDKYILGLANKAKPKVLLIPIASNDYQDYIDKFKNYYEKLGAEVDLLALSYMNNDNLIRSKIFGADIIYIGGGNSGKMMRVFKRCNLINYLKDASLKGIILTGISAGAMAFFTSGYSDANRSTNPNAPFCEIKGLGLINYAFSPHFENEERKNFKDFAKEKGIFGIALESNAGIIYLDDKIIGSIGNGKAYLFKNEEKSEINKI